MHFCTRYVDNCGTHCQWMRWWPLALTVLKGDWVPFKGVNQWLLAMLIVRTSMARGYVLEYGCLGGKPHWWVAKLALPCGFLGAPNGSPWVSDAAGLFICSSTPGGGGRSCCNWHTMTENLRWEGPYILFLAYKFIRYSTVLTASDFLHDYSTIIGESLCVCLWGVGEKVVTQELDKCMRNWAGTYQG